MPPSVHISSLAEPVPLKIAAKWAGMRLVDFDTLERVKPTKIKGNAAEPFYQRLSTHSPQNRLVLDNLLRIREKICTLGSANHHKTLSEQRDGVGQVLDIAGLDRPEILRGIRYNTPPRNILETATSWPADSLPF